MSLRLAHDRKFYGHQTRKEAKALLWCESEFLFERHCIFQIRCILGQNFRLEPQLVLTTSTLKNLRNEVILFTDEEREERRREEKIGYNRKKCHLSTTFCLGISMSVHMRTPKMVTVTSYSTQSLLNTFGSSKLSRAHFSVWFAEFAQNVSKHFVCAESAIFLGFLHISHYCG